MPGKPLNITLPSVGVTVGPDYATDINDAIQALIDDVEAKVVPSEITINADLSFKSSGTAYAATDLEKVRFEKQSATLGSGNTNSVYAYDNELYFQDGAGNNVALTASGSVAGAAGNITTTGSPAYATSGVELLWSGGDLEYRFKDGSGANDFADIVVDDVEFRNGANTMTMDTNVSTDYTITWPATKPGSTLLQQVDSSGNISFSNTVVNAATFSGLITASAGLTAAANQDITVSGTGEYKHGSRFKYIHASAAMSASGTTPTLNNSSGEVKVHSAGTELYLAIPLDQGDRIEELVIYYNGANTGTKTFKLQYKSSANGAAATDIFTPVTSTASSAQIETISSINHTIGGSSDNAIFFVFDPADALDRLLGIRVKYDRP